MWYLLTPLNSERRRETNVKLVLVLKLKNLHFSGIIFSPDKVDEGEEEEARYELFSHLAVLLTNRGTQKAFA